MRGVVVNNDVTQPSAPVQIEAGEWVQAVEDAWRTSGHRITEPRIRVLRCISSYTTPFSAEQLYTDLQQDNTFTPGRATVYRALEQLASAGWIARIHTTTGEAGYCTSWPGHIHHMVCTSCGKVVAFRGCELDRVLVSLTRQTDFAIEGHMLEIYGLCADCQQSA
jgi:Fur family ferric uptake transcriptional regulator